MNNLTLAIVTYNRPEKLCRCLESLANQTTPPKKIIIIDNNLNETAKPVVMKFHLPIQYVVEPVRGTAHARNRALMECKSSWIGFVDDDCVVDRHWVERAQQFVNQKNMQQLSFVFGQTLLLNPSSFWARSQYICYRKWFNEHIKQSEILDTKNVLINMKVLNSLKIHFDEQYHHQKISSCEDMDLGKQFEINGFFGTYVSSMLMYHPEPDTLRKFVYKAYFRGIVYKKFSEKWNIKPAWKKTIDFRSAHNSIHTIIKIVRLLFYIGLTAPNKKKRDSLYPHMTILEFIAYEIHNRAYVQGFLDAQKGINS